MAGWLAGSVLVGVVVVIFIERWERKFSWGLLTKGAYRSALSKILARFVGARDGRHPEGNSGLEVIIYI